MQINITGTLGILNAVYEGSAFILRQENILVNTTQSFSLPKDFSLELSGFFQSPALSTLLSIYKTKAFGSLNLGIQKKLAKAGMFRFAIESLAGPHWYRTSVNVPQYNLVSNFSYHFYSAFRLTYSRNFGNQKLKAKRDRSTGAEDEKGRVNY